MRGRQLTLVSHGVLPASVADLEGVLLGPGQLARMGGTARLSVVVDHPWRQAALIAAFRERGIPGEAASTEGGQPAVRTPFVAALGPAARSWAKGAVKNVPDDFNLDGQRLRLWAIAAGRQDGTGYLFTLGAHDAPNVWSSAGSALAVAGLPGNFLQHGARSDTPVEVSPDATPEPGHGRAPDGPAYRVSGRRRLARLAELVGDPPPGADPADWPT
jgi:hypothetical protein